MEKLKEGAVKVLGKYEVRVVLVCAAGLYIFDMNRLAASALVLAIADACAVLFDKGKS